MYHDYQVDLLISKLKRRQIVNSGQAAIQTAYLMRKVIAATKSHQADKLIDTVKEIGKRLVSAQPMELVVGNIIRRVLHIIREEYTTIMRQEQNKIPQFPSSSSTMFNLLETSDDIDYSNTFYDFKQLVIDGIKDLIDELETQQQNIANQALEHIHSNEIIMTLNNSETVQNYLKQAAKTRTFQVIVADTSPTHEGQVMAKALASVGIETTLIPDSAIFAVMSRVNKVILGSHTVTANGGLIACTGSRIVATAAKYHSTPVVVCIGLYKLSPQYPFDVEEYNLCVSPDQVYTYDEGDILEKVDIINPYYEYVPPELVSLFITNVGPQPPTYMYRLLNEFYSKEDFEI